MVLIRQIGWIGLVLLFGGCGTSPVIISQANGDDQGRTTPTNPSSEPPYVERWTVSYERRSPETPGRMSQPSVSKPTVTDVKIPPPSTPTRPRFGGCPRFHLPKIGGRPKVPDLDERRRDDYRYIAEALFGHVRDLIDYQNEVRTLYARTYKQYVDKCNSRMD